MARLLSLENQYHPQKTLSFLRRKLIKNILSVNEMYYGNKIIQYDTMKNYIQHAQKSDNNDLIIFLLSRCDKKQLESIQENVNIDYQRIMDDIEKIDLKKEEKYKAVRNFLLKMKYVDDYFE